MKKLSVITPTRDGLVDINYTSSLLASQKLIENWDIQPTMISGASDIVNARNALFNLWYQQKDVDACIFIDSDISWNPEDLKRWLDVGYSLIGANYPKKKFNPKLFYQICSALERRDGQVDFKKALSSSYDYVSTGEHKIVKVEGDFQNMMLAEAVGMGFFMIDREAANVFFKWAEENMEKTEFSTLTGTGFVTGYPVFNHLSKAGQHYGEDFSFCYRLKEAQLQLVLDPRVRLRHTGVASFDGCFNDFIEAYQMAQEDGLPFDSDFLKS
jgi:hypothetical protein